VRRAFENALAFLLGDASQNSEHFALAVFLEFVQTVKHLLFGLVANAAGVVENQVGFFGLDHLPVAFRQQRADDLFGIVRVHLAPEGLDIEGLHGVLRFHCTEFTVCD